MIKLTEEQVKKLEGLGVFSYTEELEYYIIDNFRVSINVSSPNTFLFLDGMLEYNWTSADVKKLTLNEFKKLLCIDEKEETLKYMESLTIEDIKEMEEASKDYVTQGLQNDKRVLLDENCRLIQENRKLKQKKDKYKRKIFKLEKKICDLKHDLNFLMQVD